MAGLIKTWKITACSMHGESFFYIQKLFTHRRFHTQTLLHSAQESFYADAFTQTLLHRCFYTDAFTHRSHHTHTEALYTHQKKKLGFLKSIFGYRPSVRAKGLQLSFWWSNLISCERVARDDLNELALLPSFLRSNLISCKRVAAGALEPRFVQKELRGTASNRIFTVVFGQCQRNGTSNPFARNEVLSPKTELKFRFQLVRGNPFARNEVRR